MKISKIKSFVKNKIKYLLREKNYLLNKQYIPDYLNNINIESTSICNLKCRFCAYDKRDIKNVPLQTMNFELFEKVATDCINYGYKNFGLTPVTGDIFMDKNITKKFEFLDNINRLDGFNFYTNFIPITTDKIEKLFNYQKLTHLGISIYGHDQDSFIKFSKGTADAYKILIRNLEFFYQKLKSLTYNFKIEIGHRTSKDFSLENSNSDLSVILKKLSNIKNLEYSKNHSFNNWGGIIKEEDVKDLNIKFQKGLVKKTGSCSLIYSRMTIGADGKVNACACRDANFTLEIGNLKNEKIENVISLKNPKYKNLIESQEKNQFPDVCQKCDFYKSIYEKTFPTWYLKDKKKKYFNLKDFKKEIETRS
jgi:MoaA/NifB/PqqE/SkfB family radical SAM enzyme